MTTAADPDVLVVGGGHNALVAAAYLGRAGRRVVVLEARDTLGGAVASGEPFPGLAARLSRYSYLVALLPAQIRTDLELSLELRSRPVAWYAPMGDVELLNDRAHPAATAGSFSRAGAGADLPSWRRLEDDLRQIAAAIAPTLLEPVPTASEIRSRLRPDLWTALVERPIGELVESRLTNDTLRGVVLTDALIGTFAAAAEPSLRQNRCFLYHVMGDGTGEWRVPVGGMGAVAGALEQAARRAGAAFRTGCRVTAVEPEPAGGATVRLADGTTLSSPVVLVDCAPATLAALLGKPTARPEGSQTKINLLLRRLPRLRSGLDPTVAFAGTLHLHQGYRRLEEAYRQAASGALPDPLPCEVYCHTLTDGSILSEDLNRVGYQTLTIFALHTPARLFVDDPAGTTQRAGELALASLQAALAEPLEDCLARDVSGRPCVEVLGPPQLEAELGMPGGHIFHGDLQWPWRADGPEPATVAERWGVATEHPGVLLCGSGAVRGGGVSGIAGHNAAMAVLDTSDPASPPVRHELGFFVARH